MTLPTEPIGSIPRPPELIAAGTAGTATIAALDALHDAAVRGTPLASEALGIA